MADAIIMPDLGSGMEEATLLNWTKQVGDTISAGDTIAEIETDKATVEVPASVGGTISQLIGESGGLLKVGAVIGYVGEGAPAAAGKAEGNGAAAPAAGKPGQAESQASTGGAAIPYGGSEKDAVPQKSEAQQPAPQQSAAQQPPPTSGDASQANAASGNGAASAPAGANGSARNAPAAEEADGNLPDGVRASPIARKMAEERQIDLRTVRGSGPNGRIVKDDIEHYTAPAGGAAATGTTEAPSAPPAEAQMTDTAPQRAPTPDYGPLPSGPDVEIIDTSKMRGRIAARMIQSNQQIPHFFVTVDVDVEPLLALRKQINEGLDDDSKVSVNDLIVKATALTLRQFPNLNTHYYGDKLARHKRINIGISVALPSGGLINVVAKDVDRTAISTLARLNKEMITRAREGKIKPDDIQGSTFTVSNLGPYDVDQFSAIISPPEAGILAVGTAHKVAVVLADGTIGVSTRMKVTLSADHRATDGAEGAQFMQAFKQMMEQPMRLLV